MKNLFTRAALLACGLGAMTPAIADSGINRDRDSDDAFTIAVFGDAPYGCKSGECPTDSIPPVTFDSPDGPNPGDPRQIAATPAFIDAVNADSKVRLVVHTGDIHSGSQYCTLAYNRTVSELWKQFKDPLVYTPGDNEWADCNKSGEGGNVTDSRGNYVAYAAGNPVANLALVRSMFFATPGQTLGGRKKQVISQALAFDPLHPTDAEYVENVMWKQSGVLFVTLNIPGGSNNDDDNWYKATTKTGTQIQEIAQRTAADLRWLDAAFAKAQADGAKAVVIVEQADMWDLDGKPASHIANYETFIDAIAANAKKFVNPVLLINGDSHNYRSDNPLKAGQPCVIESGAAIDQCSDDAWKTHESKGYDVTNFHRLVVHGSSFPLEYVRMTVDPRANNMSSDSAFGPLSWERVSP